MKKVFIRTIHSDDKIECSWYNVNGRRYKHEIVTVRHSYKTVKECDDLCGFLPYAKQRGFSIIDNYTGRHTKTVSGLKELDL